MNKLIASLIVSGFSVASFAATTATPPAAGNPGVAPAVVAATPAAAKVETKAEPKADLKKTGKEKTAHKEDAKK